MIKSPEFAGETDSMTVSSKKNGFKRIKRIIFIILFSVIAFLGIVFYFRLDLYVPSIGNLFTPKSKQFSLYKTINSTAEKAASLSIDEIQHREPIYTLDIDRYVMPEPDSSKYDASFENYSDSTIEVHYYSEVMLASNFHFIDVRIKHPSQLRMALAYDKYGEKYIKYPSQIAKDVNAVAAIDGSFYNKRMHGVVVYKGNLLKKLPDGLDVLMIDSEGNFHIEYDRNLNSSDVFEKYDIVSALTFGPQLVDDGEALIQRRRRWEPFTCEPRAAICQFDDRLHYLLCAVEGRMKTSDGVTMQQFADVLASKGVKTAYNLDGGKSGSLILGNHIKNKVAYGGEREIGDILYFATALEDNKS